MNNDLNNNQNGIDSLDNNMTNNMNNGMNYNNDLSNLNPFVQNTNQNPMNTVNLSNFEQELNLDQNNNNMQNMDNSQMYYPNNAYGNGYNMDNGMNQNPNNGFNNYNQPTVAPEPPQKKKKKTGTLVIILIIVCLIIGGGLFFYLRLAGNKVAPVTIDAKTVDLELGSTLDTTVEKYATVSNISASSCTVDLSKVDIKKEGIYEYTVKCGEVSKTGSVKVADTTAPKVTTKEVTTYIGGTYKIEDFIDSCDDASECSFEYTKSDVTNNTNAEGTYEISITVSDEAGNKTDVTGKLVVSGSAPVSYLTCSKDDTSNSDYVISNIDKIGLQANYTYSKMAKRVKSIKFVKDSNYLIIKSNYENDKSYKYNNYEGIPKFNDSNYELTYENSLTSSTLDSEYGSTFPTSLASIRTYYTTKGYTCKLERA
ncbi:MAG: hypothetical protein IJ574_02265 [Bacilli bacterium]|nr:hypothetical protein [Bacilli bacterium]